jgi:hypothetical protein
MALTPQVATNWKEKPVTYREALKRISFKPIPMELDRKFTEVAISWIPSGYPKKSSRGRIALLYANSTRSIVLIQLPRVPDAVLHNEIYQVSSNGFFKFSLRGKVFRRGSKLGCSYVIYGNLDDCNALEQEIRKL